MSKLLINESPLQVLPSLAVAIGLNEAILLQQLHYWLGHSTVTEGGKRWVYNTLEEWQKQLPFWSVATIKRAFSTLCELGIVERQQLSKDRRDKTNYYTINYPALDELPIRSNCTNPRTAQFAPVHEINLIPCYIRTETTTETTNKETKKTPPLPPKGGGVDSEFSKGFLEFWGAWPRSERKQAKGQCYKSWKKAKAESHAAEIIKHVEACKESAGWSKDNGQYIPAPLVYLNQRRWEGAEEELQPTNPGVINRYGPGFEGVL